MKYSQTDIDCIFRINRRNDVDHKDFLRDQAKKKIPRNIEFEPTEAEELVAARKYSEAIRDGLIQYPHEVDVAHGLFYLVNPPRDPICKVGDIIEALDDGTYYELKVTAVNILT